MKAASWNNDRPWRKAAAAALLFAALALPDAPASVHGMDDAQSPSPEKRDPFWPVGYRPEGLGEAETPDEGQADLEQAVNGGWSEAMAKLKINGISSRGDSEFFAVVNGQVKSVGDTVSVSHGGVLYTWAMADIQPPNVVKLRRVSAGAAGAGSTGK